MNDSDMLHQWDVHVPNLILRTTTTYCIHTWCPKEERVVFLSHLLKFYVPDGKTAETAKINKRETDRQTAAWHEQKTNKTTGASCF